MNSPQTWNNTACTEKVEVFFGPEGEDPRVMQMREQAAIRVCTTCPVRVACLEHALSQPEKYGVWGGMGEKARERLRLQRQRLHQSSRQLKHPVSGPGRKATVGDTRILQGLAVDGYDLETVYSWSRISTVTLAAVRSGSRRTWAESTSHKLRRALPRILGENPCRVGAVSSWALSQGWVSLTAWDMSEIDELQATPAQAQARVS